MPIQPTRYRIFWLGDDNNGARFGLLFDVLHKRRDGNGKRKKRDDRKIRLNLNGHRSPSHDMGRKQEKHHGAQTETDPEPRTGNDPGATTWDDPQASTWDDSRASTWDDP